MSAPEPPFDDEYFEAELVNDEIVDGEIVNDRIDLNHGYDASTDRRTPYISSDNYDDDSHFVEYGQHQEPQPIQLELSEFQTRFHHILHESFRNIRVDAILSIAIYPIFAPLVLMIVGTLSFYLHWWGAIAIEPIAAVLDPSVSLITILIPIIAILVAFRLFRTQFKESIALNMNNDSLKLGRLRGVFSPGSQLLLFAVFSYLIGAQAGLLYGVPGHFGVKTDGSFLHCLAMTIDNVFFGVFLDFFELFGFSFSEKISHNLISGTFFFSFRIAFELISLTIVFKAVQAYRLRHIVSWRGLKSLEPVLFLTDLQKLVTDESAMSRRFFDEIMFLSMGSQYLMGDFVGLKELEGAIGESSIDPTALQLFLDDQGHRICPNRQ